MFTQLLLDILLRPLPICHVHLVVEHRFLNLKRVALHHRLRDQRIVGGSRHEPWQTEANANRRVVGIDN